jgi:hypothetical protein
MRNVAALVVIITLAATSVPALAVEAVWDDHYPAYGSCRRAWCSARIRALVSR